MKRSIPLFWPLQVGGWLTLYAAWLAPLVGKDAFAYYATERGVSMVVALVLTTGMWRIYRRLFRRGVAPWGLMAVSAAAAYVGAFLWNSGWYVLHNAYVAPYFGQELDTITSVGFLFISSVYNAPVLLAWSLLYFGIKYYQALRDERERSIRAQADAHEARLRALRYQLNPHFLFNTLNGISTLVVEERTREAAAMIARLSDFLRATLEDPAAPVVPLADEIELARRYLEIEQIRFGERLRVRFDIADDVLAVPVPVLILQPLIENAIKHVVASRLEGGLIEVEARSSEGMLLLTIADDGPGLGAPGVAATGGIGLSNTRDRLAQLYGERERLELDEAEGGGLRVSIRIPLDTARMPAAAVAG